MQIEDRTYYEEVQKMEANWILVFIVGTSLSTLAIALGFLINKDTDWLQIGIVAGAIILSDAFIVFLFKKMKLELALTKKGMHYQMATLVAKDNFVSWNDIESMCIRKSPAKGYGKKRKFRYGDVYAMNLKQGVELTLKDGKKKFFSLKDPEEFIRGFKKIDIAIELKRN